MVTDTGGVGVGDILQPGRITQEPLLLSSEQIDGSPGSQKVPEGIHCENPTG